jgi:predicted transcriptional regulator
MKQEKTANDWLKELMEESHMTGTPDIVPEGWITLSDMATQLSVPMTTMNSRIIKLTKLGKIQKKTFRINTGRGISPVLHYYKK